jgi:hypothetical protein
MTPTYRIRGDGDTCECQTCLALVANNTKARDGHDEWHDAIDRSFRAAFNAAYAGGPA